MRDGLVTEPSGRIGIREARVALLYGRVQVQRISPAAFRCSRLAAQLADEWVEYVEATEITAGPSNAYRRAIERFCAAVDVDPEVDAGSASLASPALAGALARWERRLPSGFSPGSMWPGYLAASLRGLIIRRDEHPERPVAGEIVRLVRGPVIAAWGETSELDEFSRQDKQALIKAAWSAVVALEKRIGTGRELADAGRHPADGGWLHLPDLLWGISRQAIGVQELRGNLPPVAQWPAELRTLVARPDGTVATNTAKQQLARRLVAHLYPSTLELHAFRVLLVDATGLTSEEVTSFGEQDVEFLPRGVRLTVVKKRAGRVRHRAFRDSAPRSFAEGPVEHEVADRPRREASAVIRSLLKVTAGVRERIPAVRDSLFVRAAIVPDESIVFDRWNPSVPSMTFAAWLKSVDVSVSGAAHIGRLRKSTKVEKAIVAGGRLSAAADDHTRETFAGHYAQGTTLRIVSGEVITTAQRHWFDKAVDGPTVVTADAAAGADGARLQAWGLTAQEAEGIVRGQLDMGISHCKNPYESPFSPSGELCAVAPLRCLECRNAWVLPSHLPQLLLFEEHLEKIRRRLAPERFTALWGQSYMNLRAVLAERSPEEIALARKHIEAGQAELQLPLAAHQEFDR